MQITKIVITGDTQRPLSQRGNVDILANLLRLPIKLATGIDIEVCYPDNLLSLEDWVKAQKVVSSKERPYWLWDRYDLSTTAFIGFEMPEIAMAQAFEGDVAATVVDMRISPVRFGDDLYFSMRSSPDYKFCSVSPFQVRYEADMMKAAVMRLPGMGCPPDTALIIGQNRHDRSLILDGELKWFDDYLPELIDLFSKHPFVIYKPHPYSQRLHGRHMPQGFMADDENFLAKLPDHWVVADSHINAYRLLAEPNISTVCGLSSSMLTEARHFDKSARFLMPPPNSIGPTVSPFDVFTPYFWAQFFGEPMPKLHLLPPMGHSTMRRIFGVWWAYDFLK